jgi:DMSO/TMAO reductase YedYZ molybdopterin-dependent catalytic subunit
MAKRFWLASALLLAASLVLAGCGGGGAPKVDWDLSVTGDVAEPLTLSYDELAKMELIELNDVLMEKSTGEDEVTSWAGVPLADVFERAGVSDPSSITVLAADGYAIEVTRDELQGGIVALKDAEGWIAETAPDDGPIRLVTPQTPANRWVFQLTEIQIHQ